MDVWVIEDSGFPDERFVWGVASSVEAAVKFMKEVYAAPYVVEWEEPVCFSDKMWMLTGNFTAVAGHCGAGKHTFEFWRFTVDKYDGNKTCDLTYAAP